MNPQDLEWLLAQAKGSPQSLQSDVSELLDEAEDRPSTNLLLTDPDLLSERLRDSSPDDYLRSSAGVDGAALDQSRPRGRRGRIDLAAVLYDLAPNCRLAIEPGAGTEVFGNEDQLQRALRLMLLPAAAGGDITTAGSASVEIRREQDWIRVSVELGPDIGVMGDPERRWLHRIAIKHGGKFELRGNTQCLLLPADVSTHAEVEALQRELEQAQMLGEAYATELASVLSEEHPQVPAPSDRAALRALSETLLPILNQAQRELRATTPVAPALIPLGDLLILLTQYSSLSADAPTTVDADLVVAAAFDAVAARAARRGLQLSVVSNPPARLTVAPRSFELLVRCVLEEALCTAAEQQSFALHGEVTAEHWALTVQSPTPNPPHPSVAGVLARSLAGELRGHLRDTLHGPSLSLPLSNG